MLALVYAMFFADCDCGAQTDYWGRAFRPIAEPDFFTFTDCFLFAPFPLSWFASFRTSISRFSLFSFYFYCLRTLLVIRLGSGTVVVMGTVVQSSVPVRLTVYYAGMHTLEADLIASQSSGVLDLLLGGPVPDPGPAFAVLSLMELEDGQDPLYLSDGLVSPFLAVPSYQDSPEMSMMHWFEAFYFLGAD